MEWPKPDAMAEDAMMVPFGLTKFVQPRWNPQVLLGSVEKQTLYMLHNAESGRSAVAPQGKKTIWGKSF